jgi:hypothetical protein
MQVTDDSDGFNGEDTFWMDQSCEACDPRCEGCTGPGGHQCKACAGLWKYGGLSIIENVFKTEDVFSERWLFKTVGMALEWHQKVTGSNCDPLGSMPELNIENLVLKIDFEAEMLTGSSIKDALLVLDDPGNS